MEKLKQVLNSPLGRKKMMQGQFKTFGVSLESLVIRNQQTSNMPFILERLCRFLCTRAIDLEGIFRINGSAKLVEKIKDSFDRTGDADLETVDDIMAVAGTLKQFLRDLPDAVIPEAMTAQFVRAQEEHRKDKAECLKQLKSLLADIPPINLSVLKYISRFLIEVASKETSNKMSAQALAIVFGPNLFRCSSGMEGLKDQGVTNDIVCKFVQDYEQLFGNLDEPISFLSSTTLQGRDASKQLSLPARPPPPKFSSTDGTPFLSPRSRYSDGGEDYQRPTPSPRQRASDDDFMERASPFTFIDSDGASTVASPVLTAIANEMVTQTISNAVLEHLFRAAPKDANNSEDTGVVTSNGNQGNIADGSLSRSARPLSHAKKRAPSAPLTQRESEQSVANGVLADSEESSPKPLPKPRSARNPLTPPTSLHSHSFNEDTGAEDHQQVNVTDFDAIPRHSAMLTAVRKPQGPRNRRMPAKNLILNKHAPSSDIALEKSKEENNNCLEKGNRNAATKQSAALTQQSLPDSSSDDDSTDDNSMDGDKSSEGVNAKRDSLASSSAKVFSIPPLDLAPLINERAGTKATFEPAQPTVSSPPKEQHVSQGASAEQASLPPGGSSGGTNTAPSASVKQLASSSTRNNDDKTETSKHIHKRINALTSKIAEFEANYEAEHGYKPSRQDKTARHDIKKAMIELTKARKEAKQLEEQLQEGLSASLESLDTLSAGPAAATIITRVNGRPSHGGPSLEVTSSGGSVLNGHKKKPHLPLSSSIDSNEGHPKEPATIVQVLEVLLRRLKDKRKEANRPEELSRMSREQVHEEKLAVQKALLHFEGLHGRPASKLDKKLMQPLYGHYRQIKKILAAGAASGGSDVFKGSDMLMTDSFMTGSTSFILQPIGKVADKNTLHADDKLASLQRQPYTKEEHLNLHTMPSPELLKEQSRTLAEKKRLHRILRTFEDSFAREHGRNVQKEDRVHMSSEYRDYKYIKSKIRLIESLLTKQGFTSLAVPVTS